MPSSSSSSKQRASRSSSGRSTAASRSRVPTPLFSPTTSRRSVRITLSDPDEFDGIVSAVDNLDGVRNVRLAKDAVGPIFTLIDAVKYARGAPRAR